MLTIATRGDPTRCQRAFRETGRSERKSQSEFYVAASYSSIFDASS